METVFKCEIEIYKDIKGYEGKYQVSNIGNVKSLERKVKHSSGGVKIVRERVLISHPTRNGYLAISMSNDNNQKTFNIHQLVAIAFLNHEKCGMTKVVDHIDGNKNNNKITNLQIITPRENIHKIIREKTSKYIGVCYAKRQKKWASSIRIGKKLFHLGYYINELEAKEAYDLKLKSLLLC